MSDTYRIGIQIALASNAGLILGVLGKEIFGLGKQADALAGKFTAAKLAAIGAMAAIAGGAALGVMTKLVEKGMEWNQQLAQMKMANFSAPDMEKLRKQAIDTTFSIPGSDMTENLKTVIDLRNISGSADHAKELLDQVTKTNLVLENVTGKSAGDAGYLFMKFLEDSGRTVDKVTGQFSVEEVTKQTEWMQSVIVAMRGRVTGADLFQLRQSGKASVNSLSDQGLTNLLPFIQSLGAVQVGTALQGAQQQLLGAVQLRKQTVEWMEKYGMIDPKKAHLGKGGFFKLDPGAVTGEQTMMHDLAGWVWNVLIPQMMAKGLNKEQMIDEIKRSGLRTPLLGFIAEAIQNQVPQTKEIENIKSTMEGAKEKSVYDRMVDESAKFRLTVFERAWENLMTTLGAPMVDTATRMLIPLSETLNKLGKWAGNNPEMVGHIEKVVAVIAGGVMGIGIAAVIAAMAPAVIALAASLLPFAIGAIAAVAIAGMIKDIPHLGEALVWLGDAIKYLYDKIPTLHPDDPNAGKWAPTEGGPVPFKGPGGAGIRGLPSFMYNDDGTLRWHWKDIFGHPAPFHNPNRGPLTPPPPPPVGKQSLLQNNIYLDGRKIAEVVSEHLGRARPTHMPTSGDPRSGGFMPGTAFG